MSYYSIKEYYKTIRALPVLLESEERGLLCLLRFDWAGNRLIEGYLWLIPQLIMRYRNKGIDMEELIAIGNLALTNAVKAYSGRLARQDLRAYLIKSINNALCEAARRERAQEHVKITCSSNQGML